MSKACHFVMKNKMHRKNFILTGEHKKCLEIIKNTNQNLFITGKAGTGKSSLIQYFRDNTTKKVVVLAPTGIAALNCRGQTIHSFFGFPPRFVNLSAIHKQKNNRIFADIDTLVIDEISMVRADLLDGIDKFLRLNGKDGQLPFGGIQIVFVGDLFQLPPVVVREEAEIFTGLYESPYFFSAKAFNLGTFGVIELKTIFRQKEIEFINFLNNVRTGEIEMETFNLINERVMDPSFDNRHHVVLTVTNKSAESINNARLEEINKPIFTYQAIIEDDFPLGDRTLPVDLELKLKIGARVLFVKNDTAKKWVNGTLGIVHKLEENTIQVKIDETGKIVNVYTAEWNNIKYEYNLKTGNIEEEIIGTLVQYPLRLAWAITIHRSQGMTLNKVCLDFSRSPFAHGQTYVALSRVRSFEGLALTRRIWPNDILIDDRIVEFHRRLMAEKEKE